MSKFHFLFYIITALAFIFVIINLILFATRKGNKSLVYRTKNFIMIEIFTILSSTLLLISTIKNESLNTLCVFSIMAIVGTVYNIYFLNQTIKFSDDKIIVRNFLGFKRTFSYSEIQSFIIKKRSTKYNIYRVVYFYTDKKKFSVETTNVNYADFFKKVNDEYKRLNDGNNLPTRKP